MADSERRGRVCERHGVWCPDGECADCNASGEPSTRLGRDEFKRLEKYGYELAPLPGETYVAWGQRLARLANIDEPPTLLDVAKARATIESESTAEWLAILTATNPFLVDMPYYPPPQAPIRVIDPKNLTETIVK